MVLRVCRCKFNQQNGDFFKKFQILRRKLRLVIWLWFKVENVCEISILMYNLPHCLLERFCSLVKNPNSLFTMFTCLFLILYDSWIKIVWAHHPLHNLLSFLYFNYAFAMFCWLILIVIQYLSHYFSSQIVLR